MASAQRRPAPFVVAAITLAIVVLAGMNTASHSGGRWVFALDDSYIHLAMARTLAEHGVWGTTPHHFSATSSAPLYTLLLSATFFAGLGGEAWAWIFAALGGAIAAFLLTRRVCESVPSTAIATILGLACCVAVWLPETMTTGMEHTLHISAVLLSVLLLERSLSSPTSKRAGIWLALAVFIAAGLRYETIFLLPPVGWILWRANQRRLALSVVASGLLPAVVLGVLYALNGAMPLPNSVLLKGVDIEGGIIGHITRLLRQLDEPSRLILLIIALVNLFELTRRKSSPAETAPSIVYTFVLVAHAALARPDRRYLGYVLALGLWAAIPPLIRWFAILREAVLSEKGQHTRPLKTLQIACVATLALPFAEPILDLGRLPKLGQDIYAQQIQMTHFLSTQYPNEKVGMNDIGATAWAGKNEILDFWGLGDNEVARLRLSGDYGPAEMERLARERGVRVVAIYSHWFLRGKGLPESWQAVARWQIPSDIQVNCASNAVDFFATSPDAVEPLRRNLQLFKDQLPANVTVIM